MSGELSSADAAALATLLSGIAPDVDLSAREKRALAQPAIAATPRNLMRWHDDKYTVFEDETDPVERKAGVRYRRVGTTAGAQLTQAEVALQEARLGVPLPLPWRDVYRHFNGGFASGLYWGDSSRPTRNDILPVPSTRPSFLPLEDVLPLAHFIARDRPELDAKRVDPKLIALAWRNDEAIVLDYRAGDDPRVGKLYINAFDDDPLSIFEQQDAVWWPNMRVFFAGLYLQDRSG